MTDIAADQASTAPSTGDGIGRYSRAQLEAMVGKRGRKPPEFYQVFPRTAGDAKPQSASKSTSTRSATSRSARTLRVSSAVLGEHTIDELLTMIGSKGRKPAAFGILQAVAQAFVDAQAVRLPLATPVVVASKKAEKASKTSPARDTLAEALASLPKPLRKLVLSLLASAKPQKSPAAKKSSPDQETKARRGRPPGARAADKPAETVTDKPAAKRRGRPPGRVRIADAASSAAVATVAVADDAAAEVPAVVEAPVSDLTAGAESTSSSVPF